MNMQAGFSSPQSTQQAANLHLIDSQELHLKGVDKRLNQSCKDCATNKACLVKTVNEEKLRTLGGISKYPKPVQKGGHFYRQDNDFRSLYIVRSGAVKTYYINKRGEEHITGFYLPGELFGIDGIFHGMHQYSAEALDTSAVCEIPYTRLEQKFQTQPEIQRLTLAVLCNELYERQQPLLMLRQYPAQERLATFLTNLSSRLKQRGLSATEFDLPMSRRDIASYVGVAEETMSRLFSRFQKRALLSVNGRSVSISDLTELEGMSRTLH